MCELIDTFADMKAGKYQKRVVSESPENRALLSGRGVVVLDWNDAPLLLREVPALHCESDLTAQRLVRAFERPRPYPPVLVHNGEQR